MFWHTIKNLRKQVLDLTQMNAQLDALYHLANESARKSNLEISLSHCTTREPRRFTSIVPPQEQDKIRENLSVEPDNPLFQAVLCVVRGLQQSAIENIRVPHKHDMRTGQKLEVKEGFYDGCLAMAVEMEEELLERNEEGLKAKAGGPKK